MQNTQAAPAASQAENIEKKIAAAYKKYVVEDVKPTETPMSLAQFTAKFSEIQSKAEAADKITISAEVREFLTARGWEVDHEYVKLKGANAGKKGLYIKNDDANVDGAGFMPHSKKRLEKTLERLRLSTEMCELALGIKTVAQVLAA